MLKTTLILVFLVLLPGCICCPMPQEGGQATTSTAEYATPTTSAAATASSAATSTHAPTTLEPFDYSKLLVQIAGCDSDYYGNAMVAGYVKNPTTDTVESLAVAAYLTDSDGQTVSGGERKVNVSSLKPGETRKFSITYEKPPAWKKCSARVTPELS